MKTRKIDKPTPKGKRPSIVKPIACPRRYFLFSGVATYKSEPFQQIGQFIAFEFVGFPSYKKLRTLFHAQLTKQSIEDAEAEVDHQLKSLIVHSFSEFKDREDFSAFTSGIC